MTIREEYAKIQWPENVPPLTGWEAVRAASRLWRWGRGVPCPYEIRETSGNRSTYVRHGILWVNPDCRDASGGGWKSFIHDLSHTINLDRRGHSKHHARLEARMVREVIKRGWLDGRLKRDEDVLPPKETALSQKRHDTLARIEASIHRWETKAKRAKNALAKLEKRRRYYERVTT